MSLLMIVLMYQFFPSTKVQRWHNLLETYFVTSCLLFKRHMCIIQDYLWCLPNVLFKKSCVVECNRGVHFIFIDPFKFLTSLDFSISKLILFINSFLKVSKEEKMVVLLVMYICAIWWIRLIVSYVKMAYS